MAKKKAKKKVAKKETAKKEPPKKKTKKKAKKKLKGLCFVLMPFKEPFDTYFDAIITPAIKATGLKPIRGDSVFMSTSIVGDIWKKTQQAKVLIADLTEKNANVFYELGLAHAIGKPVILISESMGDVPFDLRNYRVITYDKDVPTWGVDLQKNIEDFLKATLSDPAEAVPSMFRKPVKSQAPSESATSLRLKALERKFDSLNRKQSGRSDKRTIDPEEAEHLLIECIRAELPPEMIFAKLSRRGVPEVWILDNLRKYGRKFVRDL